MTATAPRPSELAPPSGMPPAVASPGRLAWLDNVRVWLTVLVLAHHAALTYSDIPIWPYSEQPGDGSSVVLDALIGVNQSWFMGMFFLIAGFVAPGALDRHGAAGFARRRLLRLGVPYVLFAVLLSPLFRYPDWVRSGDGRNLPEYLLSSYDSGPLWFVAVLLLFSLLYAAVRAVRGRSAAMTPGRRPGVLVVIGLGIGLGLLEYVWRIGTPDGTYWSGIGLPSPSYLPQYALCFVIGLMAARRQWLQRLSPRTAWACVPIAALSLLGSAAVLVMTGESAAGGGTVASLASSVLTSVFAGGVMAIGLVVFRTLLDRSGRVWRFLSGHAFAVYVIHAPVLVWLGIALGDFAAPSAVKALVLLVAGAMVCWSAAWLIRRIPGATRVF